MENAVKKSSISDEIAMQGSLLSEINSGLDNLLNQIRGQTDECGCDKACEPSITCLASAVNSNSAKLQNACRTLREIGDIVLG